MARSSSSASRRSWFNWAAPRGSVAAEFVLVIGILTTVLFLTIELGLALDARLVLSAAAREGARRAAIEGGDTARVREVVDRQLALSPVLPGGHTLEIVPARASYGTEVAVLVTVDYHWRTPIGRLLLGSSLRMKGEARSRCEKVRPGT